MAAHTKFILKFSISIAFLTALFSKLDIGQISIAWASIQIDFYLFSLIMMLANSTILAVKFHLLMPPSGIRQTILQLLRINLICRFYSFFLTATVGQSVVRWYRSTKHQDQRGNFITVMVVERATFILVLCAVVLILLYAAKTPGIATFESLIVFSAFIGIALMMGICAYFFSANFQNGLNRFLTAGQRLIPLSLWNYFSSRSTVFRIYLAHADILFKSLIISLIWHFFFLLRVYLLTLALETPLDFFQIGWMASLVLFLQTIPITLNGIGLRESAYAALFGLSGLPAEQGVLFGLAFFSQMVILSVIGGVLSLTDKR